MKALSLLAIAGALCLSSGSLFGQGSLTPPPGTPAPTMKSLDQIASHGVALNSTNTPGDASNHFIIINPGSYYLTGNLAATEANAIRVAGAGVTIDLNGFQISTSNGTPGDGITIVGTAHHCTVKNGSITGFAQGINTLTQTARNCLFRDITASNCTNFGIRAGEGAVLEGCRVHDCSGANAIAAGTASTLRDCTASHNTAVNAIQVGGSSTVTNCTASSNTGTSAISVGFGSTLLNCAAVSNTVTNAITTSSGCVLTNCTAASNTATNGFSTGTGCTLHGCAAQANTCTFGFTATGNCSFNHCTATSNTSSATTSAGFNTTSACKFTDCSASLNTTTASPATNSTAIGFNIGNSSSIQGCTADGNLGDGIRAGGDCFVLHDQTSINQITDAAGIHVLNNFNRIEGNRVTVIGGRGIQVDGTDNVIVGNYVTPQGGSNPVTYSIAANNSYGPIVSLPNGPAVTGSSAGSALNDAAGGSHPWANFSH